MNNGSLSDAMAYADAWLEPFRYRENDEDKTSPIVCYGPVSKKGGQEAFQILTMLVEKYHQ